MAKPGPPPEKIPATAAGATARPTSATARPTSALAFWAYLTISISLLTFILSSLPSSLPLNHPSSFLTLPDDLRRHYSAGKLIKTHPSTHIFVTDLGPRDASETVLLLPGLGCTSFSYRHILHSLAASGLRAVALDLPGSGFSDTLHPAPSGPLAWFQSIYHDINEKGIFWGFDHLVETGQIPSMPQPEIEHVELLALAAQVAQVVDSIALPPVHLVLHDSALGVGANWASANPSLVRSVTLVDAAAESAAFPARLIGVPVLGRILLGSRAVFAGLIKLCCARSVDEAAMEGYRLLLKGDGGRGVVEVGKGLNYSFDVGEWAESEAVRGLPVQVIWSNNWSDLWIDEGRRVAAAVPRAKLGSHPGGRWPQEDAAGVIADMIAQFVLALPRSVKQDIKEPVPEHIQQMFDEAKANGQLGHNHLHEHDDEQTAGYMSMYGLDQS